MEQHNESGVQASTNSNSGFPVPLIIKDLAQTVLSNKIETSNEVQRQIPSISPPSFQGAVVTNSSTGTDYPQEVSRYENYNNLKLLRAREELRELEDFTEVAEQRLKEKRNLFKNFEFSGQLQLRQRNLTNQLDSKRELNEKDKSLMEISSNGSSTLYKSKKQLYTGLLQDSCKKDKSLQSTMSFLGEKGDLSLETSTVLSYQHFQQQSEAFQSAGLQTDNIHTDNSVLNTNIGTLYKSGNSAQIRRTKKLYKTKALNRKRITDFVFDEDATSCSSVEQNASIDVLKIPAKSLPTKLPEETIGQDMSNCSWLETNIYSNDFVNTQLVKREKEKTEEEEILFDPLQINVSSVKVEPDVIVSCDERGLASDFVAVEMKIIKHSNSIPSDGDNEFSEDDGKNNIRLSIQTERNRIERTLHQTNEMESFLVMDIKAEIEELTWNPLQNNQSSTFYREGASISAASSLLQAEPMRKNNNKIKVEPMKRNKKQRESIAHRRLKKLATKPEVFVQGKNTFKKVCLTRSKTNVHETEENSLHSCLDYSSCGEGTNPSPETLAKRAMQAERMRKNNERIKNQTMKRKARQRKSIEIVRLKKLKKQEEDFISEDQKEIETSRLTRSKAKLDETQDSGIAQNSFEIESTEEEISEVPYQTKKSHHKNHHLTNGVDFDSDSSMAEKRKLWAARMRERRARETPEETESRRLKARIAKMKSRLWAQLIVSEEELKVENARKAEEMRLMRQKRREAETPEQTAARKLKQSLQARKSRNRLEAAETPEETAKRKAARAAYLKKRKEELKAKETPEEQALRKEQRKEQRRLYKERKIMQKVGAPAKEENIITILSNSTQPEAINNDLASSWNNNTPIESNLKNTFNNL